MFVITRVNFPLRIYADNQASNSVTPTVTPAVIPTDLPTSTPNVSITATNSANVTNTINDTSNSGFNIIQVANSTDSATLAATPSATPTRTDQSAATTISGNIINTTTVDNTVNTNAINSQFTYQTINIFLDQIGNIDLNMPITIAKQVASASADPTTNVVVTDTNFATVNNVVVGSANTGNNTASGSGNLIIDTGNAYSIVSLINKVNLTVVDSTIHIITVNIYGNLNGNILLPELNTVPSCTSCSIAVTVNNIASVTNNVANTSTSGSNTVASGSGTITTGNAMGMTNITNILNTLLFQASFEHVYINPFGKWDGNFLGWDTNPAQNGGQSLDISSLNEKIQSSDACPSCTTPIDTTNTADIHNTVSNVANTGENTTTDSIGDITTGNAFAFTNIINLINSAFIKTTGFLGFINIFGSLHGNIGGANYFVTPTLIPDNTQQTVLSDTIQHKEDGGTLSVIASNNVGAYVLPGDTITFFADVKNTGTGKVYDTHLHLGLIQNGKEVGGADFSLGDISAGNGANLTTGLVLSHAINSGSYIARATVIGTTGDENADISATADSTFLVSGLGYTTPDNRIQKTQNVTQGHVKDILGTTMVKTTLQTNTSLYFILSGIFLAYIFVRFLRARTTFFALFAKKRSWKGRVKILQLFLP